MDQISYGGEWYREPLGTYTTGPPYIREWNRNVMVSFFSFLLMSQLYLGEKLIHLFSVPFCHYSVCRDCSGFTTTLVFE